MLRRLLTGQRRPASPSARPSVDPAERVYAVGDVHGRDDLLEAMLERIARDAAGHDDGRTARIVFLGDYVDRGDRSRAVLSRLAEVVERGPLRVDCLLGNHEAALLAFLDDPVRGRAWLDWGGVQTMASYGVAPPASGATDDELRRLRDRLSEAMAPHLPFLAAMPRVLRSGRVAFAHAALDPDRPLEAQDDEAVLWGRVPGGREPGLPGHLLVHGHFDAPGVVDTPMRVCVDTGAYHSGRLTAARLDAGLGYLEASA